MRVDLRFYIFYAALLPGIVAASAQQPPPPNTPPNRSIHLDVSVAARSGEPVAGLLQQDFTLLDNNSAQPMTSFKPVSAGQEPVEVILLMDAVNTRFDTVAYEQGEIQKFLRSSGKLSHPTTIAILTDKGAQIEKGFSTDGNVLSHLLDGYTTGLRNITRSTGYWGATERLQISLTAVRQLTAYAATLPGRKIVLWVSPGWPLLSGVRMELDAKQEDQIFSDVTSMSTQLREARVTLYNINPRGVGESVLRADYYQEFVKGVRKPSETRIGDLGLQVLAVQSGGLALESNNDIANSLKQCLAETESWYEIDLPMPPAERANEYHHIEIKLDKPGLKARTRDGYYAQPGTYH
jgi:VWFA-related protein